MRKTNHVFIAAFILLLVLFSEKLEAQTSLPKGSDVPRILSYQGQLATTDGKVMNGTHHLTASLYSDRLGRNSVWHGDYSTEINNGVFNILLGSGNSPLPEGLEMNRPLWFGIKVDDGEEMKPLSQLSAAAYSLNVPDKSITQAKLSEDVQSAIFGSGHTPTTQNSNSAVYWSETGNTLISAPTNYIGTSDTSALEIHVYDNDASNKGSKRVMRFEPTSTSPIIIGGYQGNLISGSGSIICGGGTYSSVNEIRSEFCVIGGGSNNLIDVNSGNSAILGGNSNKIDKVVSFGYIGVGVNNEIHDTAVYSAILGGIGNAINNSCKYGFIGGGNGNSIVSSGITNSGQNATITGGDHLIAQSYAQTVMGHYNSAQGNSTSSSIDGNDRVLIIGNGPDAFHRKNAFEVTDSGHSIVYHTHNAGNAQTGATYQDNIIYGWGYWENPGGGGVGLKGSFGVSVTNPSPGVYNVTLNLVKPDGTPTCLNNKEAAVIVTPYEHSCYNTSVSGLTNNGGTTTTFTITISYQTINPPSPPGHNDYWLGCNTDNSDFMFIITGRPK